MPKKTLHLVWNAARNECVGFLDKADAKWTATGLQGRDSFGAPTIGEAFRDAYGRDAEVALPTSTIEIDA